MPCLYRKQRKMISAGAPRLAVAVRSLRLAGMTAALHRHLRGARTAAAIGQDLRHGVGIGTTNGNCRRRHIINGRDQLAWTVVALIVGHVILTVAWMRCYRWRRSTPRSEAAAKHPGTSRRHHIYRYLYSRRLTTPRQPPRPSGSPVMLHLSYGGISIRPLRTSGAPCGTSGWCESAWPCQRWAARYLEARVEPIVEVERVGIELLQNYGDHGAVVFRYRVAGQARCRRRRRRRYRERRPSCDRSCRSPLSGRAAHKIAAGIAIDLADRDRRPRAVARHRLIDLGAKRIAPGYRIGNLFGVAATKFERRGLEIRTENHKEAGLSGPSPDTERHGLRRSAKHDRRAESDKKKQATHRTPHQR